MSETDYKILIVNGQSIYDNNATGITLRSVFSNYDENKILEVFYSQVPPENIKKEGIKSLRLDTKIVPLNYIIRKTINKNKISSFNKDIQGIDIRSSKAKNSIKVILKYFVLGLINYSPIIVKDKKLLSIVDNFSPDVIYTLGADIIPLKLANYFSKRYDSLPILLHYMDNWPQTKYSSSLLFRPFYNKLHSLLNDIQQSNKTALVISEKMAKEYDELFAPVKHYPLMNSIDANLLYYNESAEDECNKKVVTFAYLGGLHLDRDKQLLCIERAISTLNKKREKAQLVIYTSDTDREKYENEFTDAVFRQYVDHKDIFKEYSKADVLVHIESFDTDLIKYTKYSISTKISEYMLSKKPILLFAPEELAVYQYVKDTNCGICVDNEKSLIEAIDFLSNNESKRKELGEKGFAKASEKHTKEAAYLLINYACNELVKTKRE